MAADLVENPSTLQMFSHDLESAFYVIYYLSGFYREATWSTDERSAFLHHTLNPDTCGQTGGKTKRRFISGNNSPAEFTVKDNLSLTNLLDKLQKVVQIRYQPYEAAESAFLDLQAYEDLPYNHDRIIQIINDALKPTDPELEWPVGDSAKEQDVKPTHVQARFVSSTKSRGSRPLDDCPSSASKRQKSSSLA
jgi:hypothetical protein